MQEIICENGEVWKCDYPISSENKYNWFYIITELNVFSRVSFWIKYKDAMNNLYYQKFTLHPWLHVPNRINSVDPPETLQTDAPYLEV